MALETEHHLDYSLIKDREKKTMWINGPHNCLGRFSPLAYEIYRKLTELPPENKPNTDTLSVKIKTLNDMDWHNFKSLMKEHHGIDLSEEENPLDYVVIKGK